MNLYLRLLLTWLRCSREQSISTRDACVQNFRVGLLDIDLFGHMNNGRYLQIMDVARFRWLLRTGTIRAMRSHGWTVALGGQATRFRKPLKRGQRFSVFTRMRFWDERWFYVEHIVRTDRGELVAIGLSRAAFRAKGRWLATRDVIEAVDPGRCSDVIPCDIRTWTDTEHMLERRLRALLVEQPVEV